MKKLPMITLFILVYGASMSQNFSWLKKIGGTGLDLGTAITVDGQGMVYSAGMFVSVVDFDPGSSISTLTASGSGDLFFCKHNSTGQLQWVKQATASGYVSPACLVRDAQGNFYSAGQFEGDVNFAPGGPGNFTLTSTQGFNSDAFVVKWNALGQVLWAKQIGGPNLDFATELSTDTLGNVFVCGTIEGDGDLDPGPAVFTLTPASAGRSAFVVKLNSAGALVWAKVFTGTNPALAINRHLTLSSNGDVIVTGNYSDTIDFDPGVGTFFLSSISDSLGTTEDVFVVRLNNSGDLVWVKSMGGSKFEYATSVNTDSNAAIYVAGAFEGTFDADPSAGLSNLVSNGQYDAFLCKLDASGNLVWAGSFGGSAGFDQAANLHVSQDGNLFVSGFYTGVCDFDLGPGTQTFSTLSSNNSNGFVLKLSTSGTTIWTKVLNSKFYNATDAVVSDTDGSVYITGQYADTTDFDPGIGQTNVSCSGITDAFVLRLQAPVTTDLGQQNARDTGRLYPNPTAGVLLLETEFAPVAYQVYDQLGKQVAQGVISAKREYVDLSQLPKGLYFMEVKSPRPGVYKVLRN